MPSYIEQISNSGPKVWYRFNETAGTPVNFGSLSTTSTFIDLLLNEQTDVDGRAVYLNGSNSYIQLPSHPEFSLFNDRSFTVECWVKIANADTNRTSPLEIFRLNAPSSPHYAVSLTVDGTAGTRGKVRLGSAWTTDILSTNAIDDGTWHHIVYTYNTSSVKLYIDGTLNSSTTPTNLIASFNFDQSTKKLIGAGYVGTAQSSISQYFKGRIDEFAAYDYELTSTNILANFNAGASVELASGSFGTATSLMVQPTVSASFNPAAQAPMTASAVLANVEVSNFDDVNGIQKIISDLGPETWIKFDYVTDFTTTSPAYNAINYGSGGSFTYNAGSGGYAVINQTGPGQEPSIELQIGSGSNHLTSTSSNLFTTEISDSNFSIGIWFKVPTGIDTSEKQIFAYAGPNHSPFSLKINNKKAVFALQTSHTTYTHTETNDISENVWHLAVIKLDLAATTLKYYLDGTEVFSDTAIQGNRATPTSLVLGKATSNGTDTGSKRIELAHYFGDTYSDVTPTVITNLYNAGTRQNQAKGVMRQPIVRFQNKFDDFVDTLTPVQKLGFNETTGTVLENTGSNLTSAFSLNGSSYTRGTSVPTKNRYGYNFTNKNTYIAGNYSTATNSYADNTQTISVYAKINTVSGSDIQMIAAYGLGGGAFGIGLSLFANASGPYLAIVPTSNPANIYTLASGSTSYFGDYHLYTLKRDGTSVKLYIDGKQVASGTYSAYNFTDSGYVAIGGGETVWLGASAATVNKFVDEFAAFDYALSDQQIFDMWQTVELDKGAASSEFVMPTNIAGNGPTVSASPMTASGLLPMPTEVQEIVPIIATMNAHAIFQHPNYGGNVVIDANYGTTSMTADAEFHVPGFSIGEINSAIYMQASALMVHPQSIAGGNISVNPFIALNARLVDPGIVTIKGALVKAQTLNANAFAPLPPQYFTIADDLWYQRLIAIDQKDSVGNSSIVFFNTSDNFYVGSDPIPGSGWTAPLQVGITAINAVTTPLPAINGGYFDAQNRKAVNLRNIALTTGYTSGNLGVGDRDFTFEAMIKTTKSNQVLFVGENENSANFQRTGIILRDGKLALTYSKDRRAGSVSANDDALAFIGNKNIADGEWHHIIIQNRQTGVDSGGARIQFWIDGKLDIQRYGNEMYVVNRIGYNSPELNSYSDFTISGFGLGLSAMVEENEINLNYLAAINVVPVKAGVATATTIFGTGTRGKGNRARALMLYFWPTFKAGDGYYVGNYNNPFSPVGVNDTEGKDVGSEPFDYDTFYGLSTYLTQSTQQFFDWDVFPLPVQKFYAGDTYKGDRNPLLNETVRIGNGPEGDTYKDNITDNYRYLNLMKDVYELDQYDAIFFRNYPDQSKEQDQQGLNSKTEVDAYFNLQEKELFKEFLDSLREAIDTYGISLFVTNPQLAVDLGIIEAATPVPLLRNSGKFNAGEYSDNRAPVLTGRINNVGVPLDPINEYGAGWDDTFFNDKHRVINTLEYLTDDNAFIWTDYAFYNNADEFNYGGPDRLYKSYVNRPNGLQVGDEFVFADSGNPRHRIPFQAIKPEHLKTGIPITALTTTLYEQNFDSYTEGPNPYKDYITTVALPAGTNLNGKLTGGKIFVSFSENVANSFTAEGPQFGTSYEEYHQYDLATNYWVDIAFNAGIIDANTRALYKNSSLTDAERGQPPLAADGDLIKQRWSLNGDYLVSQLVPVTKNLKGFVGGEVGPEIPPQNKKRTRGGLSGLPSSTRLRDALGRFASGTSGGGATATTGGLVTYKVTTGRIYDTGFVFIPSINTRGLWWLSDKNVIEGKVVGGVGMSASATIPDPIVTADHPGGATVSHMLAQATLVDNTSGTKNNLAVPLTASALMPTLGGRRIFADPAVASGFMTSVYSLTETDYTVTLYLNHTDPILYIRKEVIK